jgi:hypothetical protein
MDAMSYESAMFLLLWLAVGFIALALSGLTRQVRMLAGVGRTFESPRLVRMGVMVPEAIRELQDGRPLLAIFASPDCTACQARLEQAADLAHQHQRLKWIVLFPAAASATADGLHVLTDQRPLFDELGVPITPYAMLIDTDGRIVSAAPAGTSEVLEDLAARHEGQFVGGGVTQ